MSWRRRRVSAIVKVRGVEPPVPLHLLSRNVVANPVAIISEGGIIHARVGHRIDQDLHQQGRTLVPSSEGNRSGQVSSCAATGNDELIGITPKCGGVFVAPLEGGITIVYRDWEWMFGGQPVANVDH